MIKRIFRELQLCEQANVTNSFGIRNIYAISHTRTNSTGGKRWCIAQQSKGYKKRACAVVSQVRDKVRTSGV
jgi:hypothetical protein